MSGRNYTAGLNVFVMGPEGNNFDYMLFFKNFINKPVLPVDSAGVQAV